MEPEPECEEDDEEEVRFPAKTFHDERTADLKMDAAVDAGVDDDDDEEEDVAAVVVPAEAAAVEAVPWADEGDDVLCGCGVLYTAESRDELDVEVEDWDEWGDPLVGCC